MDSISIFFIGIFTCIIVAIVCDTIKDIKKLHKNEE
ncbi:hypothetical protein MM5_042 [Morganella phage vB_Mm5]